jgi:hypothetical protein
MPNANDKDFSLVRGRAGMEAMQWVAVVPSDTVDLVPACRRFYLDADATVKFLPLMNEDAAPVSVALKAGYHRAAVRRFFATGTGAVNIFALY